MLLILFLVALAFIIGRVSIGKANTQISYIPPLKIVGDVEEVVTLRDFNEDFDKKTIDKRDKDIEGINLEDLILASKPLSEENDILLVGMDGLTSKIKAKDLEESYITFTEDYGWESVNYNHPISSNVKYLKEIVVICKEDRLDVGLNIIDNKTNIQNITPGGILASTNTLSSYFEGESQVQNNNKEYGVQVYTQRRTFKLTDVLKEDIDIKQAIVMGEKGGYKNFSHKGYFEINENYIDYVAEDGKEKIERVKGVILNPPNASIMDGHYDAAHYLENDENVLFIFMDGFGYHQYEHTLDKNLIPFLATQDKAKEATTVYRPVTNAGFAAMITGQPPIESGVYSRDQREFKVDSIFKVAKDLNKKTILVQGPVGILNTEVPPTLNLDKDGDGYADNEVFQCALDAVNDDYDFVFVHFKSIDMSGHTNGDLAEETLNRIAKTDEYISKLVANWEGRVIITADHGMHSTKDGGDHGEFRYEDMIVPYMTFTGGKNIE